MGDCTQYRLAGLHVQDSEKDRRIELSNSYEQGIVNGCVVLMVSGVRSAMTQDFVYVYLSHCFNKLKLRGSEDRAGGIRNTE